jgi:hypothetical protein
MKLLCLNCSKEMSKTEVPRTTFSCGPCRETTLFFKIRTDEERTKRFFGPSVAETIRPAGCFADAKPAAAKSAPCLHSFS